jgi:hypothetical protein
MDKIKGWAKHAYSCVKWILTKVRNRILVVVLGTLFFFICFVIPVVLMLLSIALISGYISQQSIMSIFQRMMVLVFLKFYLQTVWEEFFEGPWSDDLLYGKKRKKRKEMDKRDKKKRLWNGWAEFTVPEETMLCLDRDLVEWYDEFVLEGIMLRLDRDLVEWYSDVNSNNGL